MLQKEHNFVIIHDISITFSVSLSSFALPFKCYSVEIKISAGHNSKNRREEHL